MNIVKKSKHSTVSSVVIQWLFLLRRTQIHIKLFHVAKKKIDGDNTKITISGWHCLSVDIETKVLTGFR